MSRVDEFSGAPGAPLIARIEWRDGNGATWGSDFVADPSDPTKRVSQLSGTPGAEGVVEITRTDGTLRVHVVNVGESVIWDPTRGTYTFPR